MLVAISDWLAQGTALPAHLTHVQPRLLLLLLLLLCLGDRALQRCAARALHTRAA
jgi:hypothetical protein